MTDLASITAVYQWPQPADGFPERKAAKGLEKEGAGAAAILAQSGESPVVAGYGREGLVVVTDRRTIVVKRGKVRTDRPHASVRLTRLMKHPGMGPMVTLEGQGNHILWLDTMSAANNIAVSIDRYLG